MTAHPKQNNQDGTGSGSRPDAWSYSPLSIIRRPFSLFRLPLRVSERRLLLMTLDLLAVNSAWFLAPVLQPDHSLSGRLLSLGLFSFLLLSLLWLALAQAFDAYDLRVASRFSSAATTRRTLPLSRMASVVTPGKIPDGTRRVKRDSPVRFGRSPDCS